MKSVRNRMSGKHCFNSCVCNGGLFTQVVQLPPIVGVQKQACAFSAADSGPLGESVVPMCRWVQYDPQDMPQSALKCKAAGSVVDVFDAPKVVEMPFRSHEQTSRRKAEAQCFLQLTMHSPCKASG